MRPNLENWGVLLTPFSLQSQIIDRAFSRKVGENRVGPEGLVGVAVRGDRENVGVVEGTSSPTTVVMSQQAHDPMERIVLTQRSRQGLGTRS